MKEFFKAWARESFCDGGNFLVLILLPLWFVSALLNNDNYKS